MKAKLLHIARRMPLFLLLLPLFFMLHGLNENFAPGLPGTAIKQTLFYTIIGILSGFLFYPLLKDKRKAALVGLFLLSFNFFFGALHDLAKKELGEQVLPVRYVFIIPFILVLLVCLVIWLRKTKRKLDRAFLFFNLLFVLLIAVDLINFLPKAFKKNKYVPPPLSSGFKSCDTCDKPDVYVIIADEYAGRKELEEVFAFDNSAFEKDLQTRGFHITNNSSSNYNATVYSMASLFTMDYIDLSGKGVETQRDMFLCRSIINNNNIGSFFTDQGYSIHNFSFFSLQGKAKAVNNYYFPAKRKVFLSQTFINRFQIEAGFNFFSKSKFEAVERNDYNNDEEVDRLLRKTASARSGGPKFVYAHFTRPHHPYFVDRNGQPFMEADSLRGFDRVKKQYTEHLLYTNKRLLQLVDHIKTNAARPPIILLASDHGFRQFPGQGEKPYYFMNLSAIHLPDSNYTGFYDGMSTVNTFRGILNTAFGQQLPMLKDSTSFLLEKQ